MKTDVMSGGKAYKLVGAVGRFTLQTLNSSFVDRMTARHAKVCEAHHPPV